MSQSKEQLVSSQPKENHLELYDIILWLFQFCLLPFAHKLPLSLPLSQDHQQQLSSAINSIFCDKLIAFLSTYHKFQIALNDSDAAIEFSIIDYLRAITQKLNKNEPNEWLAPIQRLWFFIVFCSKNRMSRPYLISPHFYCYEFKYRQFSNEFRFKLHHYKFLRTISPSDIISNAE